MAVLKMSGLKQVSSAHLRQKLQQVIMGPILSSSGCRVLFQLPLRGIAFAIGRL
jgi:hypothetical protein